MLARLQVETRFRPGAKVPRVLEQLVPQLADFSSMSSTRRLHRSDNLQNAVGEQIRPRPLSQPARRSACATDDVSALPPPSALPNVPVRMSTRPMTPQCSCVPRPHAPMKPVAMRVVAPSPARRTFPPDRRCPAACATKPSIENTPSVRDEPSAGRGYLPARRALQLVQIAVGITESLRLAEPDAVDDGGVIERV